MSKAFRRTGHARTARIRPDLGASVTGVWLRAAFTVLGIGLTWVQFASLAWVIPVGVVVALAAALPRLMLGWLVVLVLGLSVLWQGLPDARLLVLVAGLHLLHLLTALLLVVPWRARVQWSALVPSLARFLVIQVPTQAAAWLVVRVLGDGRLPAVPALGYVAAGALVALTLLLVVPLLRERRRTRA